MEKRTKKRTRKVKVKKKKVKKKIKKIKKQKPREMKIIPTHISEAIKKIEKVKRRAARKKKDLIKTGIKNLDKALGGGLPPGSILLLGGSPHTGKKPILMKIGHTNKKKGVIFVITDFGVESWIEMGKRNKLDLDKGIYYVDCFTKQYLTPKIFENVRYIDSPYTLTDISIKIDDYINELKEKGMRPIVIFHSLSTLLQNFGGIETYKFFQFLIGRLRTLGVTGIFSIQYTDERIARDFEGLADYLIEMREGKMKVSGFGTINDWINYKITKKGVECEL